MRERGVQSRRSRSDKDPYRRPSSSNGSNFWQALAIVALLAATAGWTTVAVLALREPSSAAAAPSDAGSFDPNASDEPSLPPVADSHDSPDLELLLPTTVSGTPLQVQSWTGDSYLSDDSWSTTMTTFLTKNSKLPADLHVAQAYDPDQGLDGTLLVYQVPGVDLTKTRDALIDAWKGDYPSLKVSQTTIGGKPVTKVDLGADEFTSYLYMNGDVVYDIETTDDTIAAAAIAAIPPSGVPKSSAAPAGSTAPAASATPAP